MARPSPPSQGGGHRIGSGQAMFGEGRRAVRARPPLRLLVERLQDLLGRDRHLVDAHADGVVDGVGHAPA